MSSDTDPANRRAKAVGYAALFAEPCRRDRVADAAELGDLEAHRIDGALRDELIDLSHGACGLIRLDLGAPGTDDHFGAGRIRLDVDPPGITLTARP